MRTKEDRARGGQFYRPRLPVVDAMCDSCPFGKPERFEAKAAELGLRGDGTSPVSTIEDAIESVESGHDFMCHATVYRRGRARRSRTKWKMCKGGVMWRRGEI